MSETTLLRSSAIVRNATIAPPQHGPVKTGELPLVQVRMTQGGPQVQEGQQRPVQILPPKDAKGAVVTGGLPMVNVKMTQNGPQLDDGQNNAVVIRDAKQGAVAAGGLPMVNVQMTTAGPQVQTESNVQGGPPQIPAALPALSQPRGERATVGARQGYIARPAYPVASQARVGGASIARIAAPQAVPQASLPVVGLLDFSTDQLMLCRHLAEKYLADASRDAAPDLLEDSESAKLASSLVVTIDTALAAATAAATAAAMAVATESVATVPTAVTTTIAAPAATSISPAPSVSYNAGRVARSYVAGGSRGQRNAGMAPRRVQRDGAPLPPVIVKMEDRRPVVQNQAEVEQAKAVVAATSSTVEGSAVEVPAVGADAVAQG